MKTPPPPPAFPTVVVEPELTNGGKVANRTTGDKVVVTVRVVIWLGSPLQTAPAGQHPTIPFGKLEQTLFEGQHLSILEQELILRFYPSAMDYVPACRIDITAL
jgi:hypothetical protein